MARVSAWMALLVAAAIVVSLALNVSGFAFGTLGPVIAAALLGIGAWRTLGAMSDGLRLLCGAWGITFGLAWYAPSYDVPSFVPGMLAVTMPVLVGAIGLALVVLHQEKKTPA